MKQGMITAEGCLNVSLCRGADENLRAWLPVNCPYRPNTPCRDTCMAFVERYTVEELKSNPNMNGVVTCAALPEGPSVEIITDSRRRSGYADDDEELNG